MVEASDKKIAQAVAAAGGTTTAALGLRFDKVAARVLQRLRLAVDAEARADATLLLALTAPIRTPGKTVEILAVELGSALRSGRPGEAWSLEPPGGLGRMRLVGSAQRRGPRLLGFVHNADVDGAMILDLAESWLQTSD